VFSEFVVGVVTIWVLTEADRGRTVLMTPEESPYRASDLEEVREPLYYGKNEQLDSHATKLCSGL
jgi:hypothetical protein